jgi:ABC-type branched-subunit amino acid transport system permease subunit
VRGLLPYLVVGIASGSIYAMAAMGLVLTFKTSGIFNFAHGAQAALGAYVMFALRERMGWPWPLAFLGSLLLAGVVTGLLLERLARGLSDASTAARVAATVGLLLGIQGALVMVFGVSAQQMRYFLPTGVVKVGGVGVRYEQILVTVFVLASAVLLQAFLARTRLSAATQAVVDDPALLSLQAISPATVRRVAWVTGSCFAAMSGMLLAPTVGLDAGLLTLLVFYAFGAAAVGAFSSLPLTYAGGIGMGVAASVLTKFVAGNDTFDSLPSTLPFIVLFVALLATPASRLIQRDGTGLCRAPAPVRFDRRLQTAVVAAGAVVALALPHLAGSRLPVYQTAAGFVILFGSLNLLVRTSGQISLCQITFAAVGAATFAHATAAGWPWLAAIVAAGLMAVPVGALVAIPAIRLSGVYLAIATFGFGLLVQNLVYPTWLMFSQGTRTLPAPRPHLFGLRTDTDVGYYYVVLVIAVACSLGMMAIRRARLGRLLRALADGPVAVDAHGASTNVIRLLVFCLSAFFAGVAGAVIAPVTGAVSAAPYQFIVSLLLVAVLFLAGRHPVASPIVASGLYLVGPGYITDADVLEALPVLFGAGAIVAALVGGRPVLARIRPSPRALGRVGRSRPVARLARSAPADAVEVLA